MIALPAAVMRSEIRKRMPTQLVISSVGLSSKLERLGLFRSQTVMSCKCGNISEFRPSRKIGTLLLETLTENRIVAIVMSLNDLHGQSQRPVSFFQTVFCTPTIMQQLRTFQLTARSCDRSAVAELLVEIQRVITDRISEASNAIAFVRPSVCFHSKF